MPPRTVSIERQRRILELLDEALELPPAERAAFLDTRCGDGETRREVEALLATEPDAGVLGEPAFSVHGRDAAIGRRIGDYRIVELLGRGGMGSVYLAEREHFDQRVALKLLRRGLDFDDVLLRRFHNERQILARLDHPNVARLLDGGTTEDRVPYFVMELVEGVPIDRYCEREGLSVDERLRLFRKVCSAVELAHRNLVVHRDLKPGNVLVTGDGEPKLLDFGIAKLLDDGLAARTLATATGHGPMTPRYASPEQIRLEPITTASDVYSLGVLLYELLTGRTPYRLSSDRSDEVARAVCEQEPEKPSTAVRRAAADDTILDPGKLRRLLSGDLDSIVLKALRKRPENRYGSVEQLSEDLRRYLDGEPVGAREGTALYRFGKFVRRHRVVLAVAAAFVLLVAAFGSALMSLRREAVAAQQREEGQQQRARELSGFLEVLLAAADPDRSEGPALTALELLKSAKDAFLERLPSDPPARADLISQLGKLFRRLGERVESRELMEEALEISRAHHVGDHPDLAKHLSNLAVVRNDDCEYARAEELLREALEMRDRLGQTGTDIVAAQNNLATTSVLVGKYQEAEGLYLKILDTRLKLDNPVEADIATTRLNLGALYLATGTLDEADTHLRRALEIREQAPEPQPTGVASVLEMLGRVEAARGDAAAAEELLNRALGIRTRRFGEDHLLVARTKTHLAALWTADAPETAGILLAQALSTFEQSSGCRETAEAESVLGGLLTERGRFEEAEPCALESHRKLLELQGPRTLATRTARERVLELYRRWGRPEDLERFRAATEAQGAETSSSSR